MTQRTLDEELLAGIRVVDTTVEIGESVARFLADLGADVIRVEPPGGSLSRRLGPSVGGVGLPFAAHNANKRSITLDLNDADHLGQFDELLSGSDIWVHSDSRGGEISSTHSPTVVTERFPALVVADISEFGRSGPHAGLPATGWTHLAASGVLSRSGLPGRTPLMPPGNLVEPMSSMQLTWVIMLALWQRLRNGQGCLIDGSRYEAVLHIIDPPFSSTGTAALAQPGSPTTRDRPPASLYPIFRCADGYVRVVVLAPRQWHSMRTWLGEPADFQDPRFDRNAERFAAADRLYPIIQEFLVDQTAADLVAEGQRRGIPIAPVLSPTAVLGADHYRERKSFTQVPLGDGASGALPSGYLLVDGHRAGVRRPAPTVGEHDDDPEWRPRPVRLPAAPAATSSRRPLEGLRVLDLGVIVMGGEAGRLLADQGADVIKVESRRFPDGVRAPGINSSLAIGQRNKRSLGLDLRSAAGLVLFDQLVAQSDVVLTNFKPGTVESLGIGYERLRTINPGIIFTVCSAMGESGAWRDWMGYGPLVRCATGLTYLWDDPTDRGSFGDSATIVPDHFAARIADVAVLAALMRRRRTGTGAIIEIAQVETVLGALAPEYLLESVLPGAIVPTDRGVQDAPWGLYPCRGDDEWCVITVRDDADWHRLVEAIGSPAWATADSFAHTSQRLQSAVLLNSNLRAWTSTRTPGVVVEVLRRASVPVAAMARLSELRDDPHLEARGFFRRVDQPGYDGVVLSENGPGTAACLADPDIAPAPFQGQHTREICRELLGLPSQRIDELVEEGVLEDISSEDAETLERARLMMTR